MISYERGRWLGVRRATVSSTALLLLLLLLLPGTNLTQDSSCAAQSQQLHTSSASTGNWITASGHLITVMVGAGVLSLPSAMSWLGWIGGLLSLLTFYAVSLWCSLMLAAVYHVDGRTHPTYSAAVSGILGRGRSRALAVVQRTMLCLAAIGYQIAAADSMSYMAGRSCPARGHCEGLRHGQLTLIFAGGCEQPPPPPTHTHILQLHTHVASSHTSGSSSSSCARQAFGCMP
jgi:hypothetical protein